MAENKKIENPNPDEKVCFNCKNMLWMVGVGQGVKCKIDFKSIASRYYTCEKFEIKTELIIK
jgi:hypothetical protein